MENRDTPFTLKTQEKWFDNATHDEEEPSVISIAEPGTSDHANHMMLQTQTGEMFRLSNLEGTYSTKASQMNSPTKFLSQFVIRKKKEADDDSKCGDNSGDRYQGTNNETNDDDDSRDPFEKIKSDTAEVHGGAFFNLRKSMTAELSDEIMHLENIHMTSGSELSQSNQLE